MRGTSVARLACAVAGLALVAGGLAGPAAAAQAGAGVPSLLIPVPGGIISTFAGGVGGPGRATSVAISPCGVDWAGGHLYIGDFSTVRQVSMATDVLTTVAGDNAAGALGTGGAATGTALSEACGTAIDGAGNLTIPDGRQVLLVAARTGTFFGQKMTAGDIYTVAGNMARSREDGSPLGDGGPATSAALDNASGVAFDRAGNLLIADSGDPIPCEDCAPVGALVRVVAARTGTFYGQKMTAGDIYSVAGIQSPGPAGDGGPAASAWLGPGIGSVLPDRAGNLVLAEDGEDDAGGMTGPSVRVIAAVVGTFYGVKMTAGDIYRVAGNGQTGTGGDGGPATRASLQLAGSAVPDAAGNLVIGDDSRVRVVAAGTGRFYGMTMTVGHIYGIAGTGQAGYSGDGGSARRAKVASGAVAVDAAGNVLLADGSNRVRAVAARTGRFYGRKMTVGHIYTVAGNGSMFSSGDGGPPPRAEFTEPSGVGVDRAGDVAFTAGFGDSGNTMLDLVPARSGTFFGRRLTAGKFYTVAGDGNAGFRGDRGPALKAEFCLLIGGATVAFDGSGNLVAADQCNNRVRLIAVRSGRFFGQNMTGGDIYTIAGTGAQGFSGDGGPAVKATLNYARGAAVDHHGNVLIADSFRVRVIAATTGTFYGRKMTAGDIYTVAGSGDSEFSGDGGPAVKAGMNPAAVAVDAAGNLIISDDSERVRVVAARTGTMYGQRMTAGDVYTIAGNGQLGFSGSGGPARDAEFGAADGATVDRHGNVIFADWFSQVVWVVAVTTGKFYGQAMTVGDIYVVAGGGVGLGDGGPATSALLSFPYDVAVSPAGSLLVADNADNRLRAISP